MLVTLPLSDIACGLLSGISKNNCLIDSSMRCCHITGVQDAKVLATATLLMSNYYILLVLNC